MENPYEGFAEAVAKMSGRSTPTPPVAKVAKKMIDASAKGRQVRRAAKMASVAGKAGTLSKLAKLATFGGGPVGTLGSIAAWTVVPMILDRLLHGSEEDQLRHQMELQAKVAGGDAGAVGGVAGSGLSEVPYQEQKMADLIGQSDMVSRMRQYGVSDRNLGRSLQRPSGTAELENLLAGDEVRMRQLQSPRILTPYEIMSAIDG